MSENSFCGIVDKGAPLFILTFWKTAKFIENENYDLTKRVPRCGFVCGCLPMLISERPLALQSKAQKREEGRTNVTLQRFPVRYFLKKLPASNIRGYPESQEQDCYLTGRG
jgi:hypothetical protein